MASLLTVWRLRTNYRQHLTDYRHNLAPTNTPRLRRSSLATLLRRQVDADPALAERVASSRRASGAGGVQPSLAQFVEATTQIRLEAWQLKVCARLERLKD